MKKKKTRKKNQKSPQEDRQSGGGIGRGRVGAAQPLRYDFKSISERTISQQFVGGQAEPNVKKR